MLQLYTLIEVIQICDNESNNLKQALFEHVETKEQIGRHKGYLVTATGQDYQFCFDESPVKEHKWIRII